MTVYFKMPYRENDYTIHSRLEPEVCIGFWALSEKDANLALKCLNGAFFEGMEHALNRNSSEISKLFPDLFTEIPEDIKAKTQG